MKSLLRAGWRLSQTNCKDRLFWQISCWSPISKLFARFCHCEEVCQLDMKYAQHAALTINLHKHVAVVSEWGLGCWERGSLPRLDSGRGRGDGLGEKLRDCAHFSQHTILYIKLSEEETVLEIQCSFTQIVMSFSLISVSIWQFHLVPRSTQPLLVASF